MEMSEITRGVIGMPFKLAMGSEMSRRQFHACAQEVFVEKERLEAQVATLKADPNSWQSGYDEGRKMGTKTALSGRDQLKAENERLELENEDTLKKFEDAVESFTKLSAEVLELRQQLAIPSDVLADCEALRLENEALRLFMHARYSVSMQIDMRGYRWSESYLDQAYEAVRAAMSKEARP